MAAVTVRRAVNVDVKHSKDAKDEHEHEPEREHVESPKEQTALVRFSIYHEKEALVKDQTMHWPVLQVCNSSGTHYVLDTTADKLDDLFGDGNVQDISYRPVAKNQQGLSNVSWAVLQKGGVIPIALRGQTRAILRLSVRDREMIVSHERQQQYEPTPTQEKLLPSASVGQKRKAATSEGTVPNKKLRPPAADAKSSKATLPPKPTSNDRFGTLKEYYDALVKSNAEQKKELETVTSQNNQKERDMKSVMLQRIAEAERQSEEDAKALSYQQTRRDVLSNLTK
jgi:hypothetical protein